MANEQNLKPFAKGDPRINRKGRPKSFDALRSLAKMIADEPARAPDGSVLIKEGKGISTVEAILRRMATNKDPREHQKFLEIAYGKVPDELNIRGVVDPLLDEVIKVIARVLNDSSISSDQERVDAIANGLKAILPD
jgi:hypothetical protein